MKKVSFCDNFVFSHSQISSKIPVNLYNNTIIAKTLLHLYNFDSILLSRVFRKFF